GGEDGRRLLLGFVGPTGQHRLGVAAGGGGFFVRLPQQPGDVLLGLGLDLGRGITRRVQDTRRLGAEGRLEIVLDRRPRRRRLLLGGGDLLPETFLALVQRGQRGRDLGEEGTHLVLVESPERGAELLPGDVVRADDRVVRHDRMLRRGDVSRLDCRASPTHHRAAAPARRWARAAPAATMAAAAAGSSTVARWATAATVR